MAEAFAFELKLVDSISGTAKRANDSLSRLERGAKKAQEALGFGKEISRADAALKKLSADPKGFIALTKATRELSEQRKKLLSGAGLSSEGFFKKFGEEMSNHFSFGKLFGAAALADALVEGAHKALDVLSDGIKDLFKAGAASEKMSLAARLSLGKAGGAELEEDVERFSGKTQFNPGQTLQMMLGLRRAGFSQQAARTAFATAADIGAGGGNADEALEAFKHIRTKGGIGERQLIGLLGNAGGTVPDFYKSLAKTLGVSPGEAKKRAEGGVVDPQLLMNMITQAVNKRQGGIAGTGAFEASKGMEAIWNKLIAMPEEYMKKISKSQGWKQLETRLGGLLEQLNPNSDRGKKIIAALMSGFDKIVAAADRFLQPEKVDAFFDSLSAIPSILDKIVTASEVLATIWAGSKLVNAAGNIANNLQGAATTAGSVTGAMGGVGGVLKALPLVGLAVAGAEATNQWAQNRDVGGGVKFGDFTSGYGALDPMKMHAALLKAGNAGIAQGRVTLHAPVNITVQSAEGEDPTHTAQRVGEHVRRHATNALERAANEAGG